MPSFSGRALGFRFRITATDDALLRRLTRVWLYAATAEAGLAGADAHFYVRATKLGLSLRRGEGEWEGPWLEPVLHARLRDEVTELALTRAALAGQLPVHAGAVSCEAGAVMIPGRSGAGKTTLVVAAVRECGLAYMSDEAASVDTQAGTLCGLLRAPNLKHGSETPWREGNGRRFGLTADRTPRTPHWAIDTGPAPIAYIVFPERSLTASAPRMQPLTPAAAALRIGQQTSYMRQIPDGLTKLRDLVLLAPAAVLHYQEAEQAAVVLRRLLDDSSG